MEAADSPVAVEAAAEAAAGNFLFRSKVKSSKRAFIFGNKKSPALKLCDFE